VAGASSNASARQREAFLLVSALCYNKTTTTEKPTEAIMEFFKFEHLPEKLQTVSRPFCELARSLVETLPRNAERTVALRKILEGKDAAVRAALATPAGTERLSPMATEFAKCVRAAGGPST